MSRSAIVTVAFGHSTEHLDHTFSSFAGKNPGVPLHAFILGSELPKRRLDAITYHLVEPIRDFSDRLREVYFRRIELIDRLDVDYALVVDSYDVLCLQPLPPFERLLAGCDVAACVEHLGARFLMGQGYTANFLNGGVFFWNVPGSRDIRSEIVARGRSYFRITADDQHVINEVIQTKYFDRLRILPCQYNYRAYFKKVQSGWPTIQHLHGVMIYHNSPSIEEQRSELIGTNWRPRAELPALPQDSGPLSREEQVTRAILQSRVPGIVRESIRWHWVQNVMGNKCFNRILVKVWPILVRLGLDRRLRKRLPIG